MFPRNGVPSHVWFQGIVVAVHTKNIVHIECHSPLQSIAQYTLLQNNYNKEKEEGWRIYLNRVFE